MGKGSKQRVQWSREYERRYERIFGMKNYCDECEGDGYIQMSCCGDDMKGRWEENDCCPSCYEHCGEPEHETCDECNGTGKEKECL